MAPLRALFGKHASILRGANFQVLLFATALPILGTTMLSPILDALIDPFGTSAANIGLMISVYTAPQIAFVPVMGVLADRYGRKPILCGALLTFGIAGIAISLTTVFAAVLGLRLLQGIAAAGLTPVIIMSIGDLYSGEMEATGQGLRFASSGLSGTVLPVIAGVIVVFGWQYPFLLYGLALPSAAMVYIWLEEPTARGSVATDGRGAPSYMSDLFELLRHRRVVAMILARGLPSVVWFGFLTYNSLIVVRLLGSSAAVAGLVASFGSLAFAVPATQAGRIATIFDSRFYPLIGANICLGSGFIVFALSPNLVIAAMGVILLGIGEGITLSIYRSIINGLAPRSLRGGLVSVAESFGWFTSTMTPIAMGGFIGIATPAVGFPAAIQLATIGAAVVGGGGGILCMIALKTAPPVPTASLVASE